MILNCRDAMEKQAELLKADKIDEAAVMAEMSFREIAEGLRIPLGTALTWMRTATLRLKEALGGDL